jgi:hypothetical protein
VTQPDFDYIGRYLGLDKKEIIEQFAISLTQLDLKFLAADVEPFLFSPEQKQRILSFMEYWQQRSASL